MVVSIENAEHYIWGDICDGWHLLKREDISIIQERVPPGATEAMHYHNTARQFFYILEGEGIEIAPLIKHQFQNPSTAAVHFLVVSVPPTPGDRVNINQATASAADSRDLL